MEQNAQKILMISPTRFGFNEEAFLTNTFQNRPTQHQNLIQAQAKNEFDEFVKALRMLNVEVLVYEDLENSETPDSIFPNNWFSTHQNSKLFTYPMAVSNRRRERRTDIINDLKEKYQYKHIDLSSFESNTPPIFLEGTGSLILDHANKKAYAALSPRTNETVLEQFAQELNYTPITFTALGKSREPIYHTNVMMCIGDNYAIIGLDTIIENDRDRILDSLKSTGKEIIEFSNDLIYNHFGGNMLQIRNNQNETILVMSQKAYSQLTEDQIKQLERLNDHLLPIEIPTIESVGGGSVRCMLAELF